MKPYVKDLIVSDAELLRNDYVLLKLTDDKAPLPEIAPGQFVEVSVDCAPHTFLRRPISINYVDRASNALWLLVHAVGEGTHRLLRLQKGERLNCLFPLGHGFSIPSHTASHLLLVGGGVGTAPLLYYGHCLKAAGHTPTFLLGGRSQRDILQLPLFEQYGRVCITTEDGSAGERGFVTNHPAFHEQCFDGVATCGPKPMMMAVARMAATKGLPCEVSLENLMACGLGACLCCVEKDAEGHNVCVCKEGPVFNTNRLGKSWQSSM